MRSAKTLAPVELSAFNLRMSPKVKHKEMVSLAQPLSEIPKMSYSLTAFKQKAEQFLERMSASNESFTLTKNGAIVAVVRDWQEDEEIERRRRSLLAVMESIETKPKTGKLGELKVRAATQHYLRLRRAFEEIESWRKQVAFLRANLYDALQALGNAEQKADRLLDEWKKTEAKG